MTLGEFKAFLEGMDIHDAPTPDQWARIGEKLAAVKPEVRTHPAPLPEIGRLGMPGRWPYEVTCLSNAS